ncbi:IS66 family transposase [Pandoraea sputorum]|uniref:IS66 family transposase n=1 Tax=Pandoraea sputorum TaxID=93222 RepID=A0A5E5BH56_9BURK|nr:transposase [Pandoraea sputorum]VVE84617.1 IS66 family transposase [Pandoraea sputorum]
MNLPADLDTLSPDELRTLAAQLMAEVGEKDRELGYRQTRIEQLTYEIASLKRLQFGKCSEQFTAEQMGLLNETIDADLAALEIELEQLQPTPRTINGRSPGVRRCRRTCHAPKSTTNPTASRARAVANVYASVKTSARSWTIRRMCSRSSHPQQMGLQSV